MYDDEDDDGDGGGGGGDDIETPSTIRTSEKPKSMASE